jgi:WS/DGAT/MGAT family acyltransferase
MELFYMPSKRMNPLDARWLLMESPDTPMHVGVLAIFSLPSKAGKEYIPEMVAEMRSYTKLAPPWNYRLGNTRRPGLLPRLVEDTEVDLDYHLLHLALPSPGGERELGIMTSRLHSIPLDRSRPLWELHVIEGLENGRFAMYVKLHHSLIDSISAIPVFSQMLSSNPRHRNMPPLWALPDTSTEEEPTPPDSEDQVAELVTRVGQATLSIGKAMGAIARRAAAPLASGESELPSNAPRSTLNRAISSQRRFATQQYELVRLKRVAAATGSTVSEILAYLSGTALRRFFKEYNALPLDSLVGLVPVNIKDKDKRNANAAIIGLRVALGTDIADPMERLDKIKKSVSEAEKQLGTMPVDAADAYAMMSSLPIVASQLALVGRFVPRLFNVAITSVPGPEKTQYYHGARLEALHPMPLLMQHSALSIAFARYDDTINVGLTGARETLPHLQRLAVYMGKALNDLEGIALTERVTS